MAYVTANLTMNGSAQQVSTTRTPIVWIRFFNVTGNAAVSVGDANISATIYGESIPAAGTATVGPFSDGAPMDLTQFWVIGTNTQVLRIQYITY